MYGAFGISRPSTWIETSWSPGTNGVYVTWYLPPPCTRPNRTQTRSRRRCASSQTHHGAERAQSWGSCSRAEPYPNSAAAGVRPVCSRRAGGRTVLSILAGILDLSGAVMLTTVLATDSSGALLRPQHNLPQAPPAVCSAHTLRPHARAKPRRRASMYGLALPRAGVRAHLMRNSVCLPAVALTSPGPVAMTFFAWLTLT